MEIIKRFCSWLKLFSYCMRGQCLTSESLAPIFTGKGWYYLKGGVWYECPKPLTWYVKRTQDLSWMFEQEFPNQTKFKNIDV